MLFLNTRRADLCCSWLVVAPTTLQFLLKTPKIVVECNADVKKGCLQQGKALAWVPLELTLETWHCVLQMLFALMINCLRCSSFVSHFSLLASTN